MLEPPSLRRFPIATRSAHGARMARGLWLALLLAPLAAGCASARASEAAHAHLGHWMERNSDPRFPGERYLVGIGQGTDANEAADDGRAAILAVFRTHIKASMTRLEQELVRTEDGRTSWSGTSFSTDAIEAQVEGTLEGAQVADSARDPHTGRSWALVVVDRAVLASNLARRIAQEDGALTQTAREVRTLLDDQLVFRAREVLREVPERLARTEAWRTELSLVDARASATPAGVSLADWTRLRAECAAALTFAVQATVRVTHEQADAAPGSSSQRRIVSEALKGALAEAEAGLGVVDAPQLFGLEASAFDALPRAVQRERAGGASFLVRARVEALHSSRFGAAHVYRGSYSAEVIDLRTGEVLVAELAGEVKGSRPHANPEVAATNSLREASDSLARALATALN